MANMKTDDSGVITTEFYTGRCPVRCELCFVNFGMNGQSVPMTIYSKQSEPVFNYASCRSTLERLSKVPGSDWVADYLCGQPRGKGKNNDPRNWGPVCGTDSRTGKEVEFWSGMEKKDFRRVLKPLHDDPGLYSIPKVPEVPWYSKVEATRAFNGQWLPSILRVNSMSDSSVAPSEWISRIRDIWKDDCFFNTNVHAIKRYPANIRAGLYHKVVVTANPGLQEVHAGLYRYRNHYPRKEDVAADSGVVEVARSLFEGLKYASKGEVESFVMQMNEDDMNGLIMIRLAAGTMKGDKDRRWHFYEPVRVSDIDPSYAQYEENIKFYRVRALPTIQPDVSRFHDVPVVYTVLRFKTVQQALEFATKYGFDVECSVKSRQDAVVCEWYGVPYREATKEEPSVIAFRSNDPLNASQKKGQWTELFFDKNFFRAGKEQMGNLEYVCDRAGRSCKACGLCATLDGTEDKWENPVMASMGLRPQRYAAGYVCSADGDPVATAGVAGRERYAKTIDMTRVPKGINRTKEEMAFFRGPGRREFWNARDLERAEKESSRKRERNPEEGAIGSPAIAYAAALDGLRDSPRRNPDDDTLISLMVGALESVVEYGTPEGEEGFWWQGWNTHEEVASLIAYVFWWLMVIAHEEGLEYEDAVSMAHEFCFDACGVDLFEDEELYRMYFNTSYWNDQFGPTF